MWAQLGRSLGIELEYLFALMAEAAMPDQLWQPAMIPQESENQEPPRTH